MRATLLALVVVFGCGSSKSEPPVQDDCKLLATDAAAALPKLQQRYTDQLQLATVIETCLAPKGKDGDECERLEKLVKALPDMGDAAAMREVCQRLPLEARRCLFPSYSLAHAQECQQAENALANPPPTRVIP